MKTKIRMAITIIACAIIFSCQKQPMACFEADKNPALKNENINFSSGCSMDMHHCEWDFGDGTKSTEKNPTHAYSTSGFYTVKFMTMSKNDKKMDESSKTITIN